MITKIKGILKNHIAAIAIASAIVIVSGGATFALLSLIAPKDTSGDQSAGANKSPKERAEAADAAAKKLIDETSKMGSGKEADKKLQEAAAKFDEASKLYKQAGDSSASYEAQANADALASRLTAEEAYKKQLEAEHAQQQAELDAAKAAMQANGQ